MKCYIISKELANALGDMIIVLENEPENSQIKFDYVCLNSLKEMSDNDETNINNALKEFYLLENTKECGIIF